MSQEKISQIEFPLNVEVEQFKNQVEPEVVKLVKFFSYVKKVTDRQVLVREFDAWLEVLVKDVKFKSDFPIEAELRGAGLRVEIMRHWDNDIASIWIEIDSVTWYQKLEVLFYGHVEITVKNNKALLRVFPKSMPKVFDY